MAIVTAWGDDQSVDQKGATMDGVHIVFHRLRFADMMGLEHNATLVAMGTGGGEIKFVNLGISVGGGEDVVSSMAVTAEGRLSISLPLIASMDTSQIFFGDLLVAFRTP